MAKADTIIIPTAAEVPALTDRLVHIETEIGALEREAKHIRSRLEAYALEQKGEPLADASREGRKVTLPGHKMSLPVLFTSDLLIGSFVDLGPKHRELTSILSAGLTHIPEAFEREAKATEQLELFFKSPNKWEALYEDGQKFRKAAAEHLPEEVAASFISACSQRDKHGVKKSKTVFDFKSAKAVEAGKEGA
jgi:hypothetical protein